MARVLPGRRDDDELLTPASSIRLDEQWRLILRVGTDDNGRLLIVVEIVDYH